MADEEETTLEDEDLREPESKGRFRLRRKKAEVEEELKEPKRRRSLRRQRREKKLSKKDFEEEEREISQGRLWLKQNWKIMMALFLLFLFGLFLRSYYYYTPATENGFILSGNDPYYHKRVADFVQEEHHHLIFDPLLSYPDGALNPRPPLFDWSVAILGLLFAPLFGGNVETSTWQVMEFSPAFWGAITVVPVYMIGKEMFNKKTGIICAFLIAVMPSHVERSPLGFADHDAIVLFFVVLSFYFFIKALASLTIRDKWVERWLYPKDIAKGLIEWFKYNQKSVAYSLLAGLSLACIALTWKGFLYPVVIIVVYLSIQLILNKFKNRNSLGVTMCSLIAIALVAFLPVPYYFGNRMPHTITPAIEIFLMVLVFSMIFVVTRDSPWLLVFPVLIIFVITGFVLLIYIFPEIGRPFFSGQGYFVKTKVYETIAEAQAPDYSRLVFSYGVVTTFLALFAVLISIMRVAKALKAHYLFMTIWGVTAVYMAVSATRFIFNAGPIFAILAGWMIYEIIKKLDFRRMFKAYKGLKGGGRFYAMRKSVKIRHIVGVLFLVFMIIIPNVWLGWDAGIPYGEKKDVDLAVYNAMPFFMKPDNYNETDQGHLKYFGAFGHGFPSDYWLAAMEWLSEQDKDLPIEDRPAFISWWDYGFWAIYLGEHPTAADNFQGEVQFAGSFISAKNENQSTSLLIARILEANRGDYQEEHGKIRLHDEVRAILIKYFGQEKAEEIEDVVVHPEDYRTEILDNPDRYGYYTSDLYVSRTPIYVVLQTWIPELIGDDERVWLLHELQEETGYCLRYFAIDSRLFPYGPRNTGIFYAPLKLSDHRINDYNEPYDFIRTYIQGSDFQWYTMEGFKKASEDDPDLTAEEWELRYYEPFLDSMLLKCYIGYTFDDIGATDPANKGVSPNIPAVHDSPDRQDDDYPVMQGWMMKHFQLVYRTTYWNPYNESEYKNHPDEWVAMSDKEASEIRKELEAENKTIGVISSGIRSGVVFLKYYEGAYLNGTITTFNGTPVPNVRVTVLDDYGIPHDSVHTDENGTYHLIAPAGNVTVSASYGGLGEGDQRTFNMLFQREINDLNTTNINISDDQVMRRKIDEDEDGIWDYNLVQNFELEPGQIDGRVFWDTEATGEYDALSDINISDTKVILFNKEIDKEFSVKSRTDGYYIADDLCPGTYNLSVEFQGHNILANAEVFIEPGDSRLQDIAIPPSHVNGKVISPDGENLTGINIELLDRTNGTTFTTSTDSIGNYSYDWLLPGNYSIDVNVDGFEEYHEDFNVELGKTVEKIIVLTPSTNIEGITSKAGTGIAIANVTIRFEGQGENEGINKFTRSNATGFYSIALKDGDYIIHVRHDLGEETPFVYTGEIQAQGGEISLDITLQKSIEVFGTVWRDLDDNGSMEPIERNTYLPLYFESSSYKGTAITNVTGFYRTYLPYGNYSVYAHFERTGDVNDTYSYIMGLSLLKYEKVEHEIELEKGRAFDGYVYYDLDENDARSPSEGLSYATLTFADENGTEVVFTSDQYGAYSVNLPMNQNYSVLVVRSGFESKYMDFMDISNIAAQSLIKLYPLNVTTHGMTLHKGSPIYDVNISFVAVNGTGSQNNFTTSNQSGNYSLILTPGEYNIHVDFNTTEGSKPVRYLYNDTLYIEIGEGSRELNLNLTKKIKINGTINGTVENVEVYFDLLDEEEAIETIVTENGSFELYLIPNEYEVSVDYEVDSDNHYVYLDIFNFTESEVLELNLTLGVKVNGTVEYNETEVVDISINFTNNGTINFISYSEGNYEVFLPPNRTYEVLINQTRYDPDDLSDVRFTFYDTLDINTTFISDLKLNLTKYIEIDGIVFIDWDEDSKIDTSEAIDNITLNFNSDIHSTTVVTDSEGKYNAFLLFEKRYNISISSDFKIVDEPWNVTPKSYETRHDFSISPANLTVTGRTLTNGTGEGYTALWFWALEETAINKTTISDMNGNFTIDLATGNYTLYARKVSGSKVFVYLAEISVKPRGNLVFDLDLVQGVKVNGIAYYINSTGENLSAPANLEFKGIGTINTTANEHGQFEVWLPADKYLISANLTTMEYNKSMKYIFKKTYKVFNDTALYLNLSKVKVFEVELEWLEGNASTINQSESVSYNISVMNTGNVKDTFDIGHVGVEEWNLTYPQNITLGIEESKIFEVHINTSSNATVEHGNIKIFAMARSHTETNRSVDIQVNITQVHGVANLSFATEPTRITGNTMLYNIDIKNMGNGEDDFTMELLQVPDDWNATMAQTEFTIPAYESRGLIIEIHIPYESEQWNATLLLRANSSINITSEMEIEVGPPNLSIEENDINVTGENVTEGALDTSTIPGFETITLVVGFIAVAIVIRRRRYES